MPQIDVVAVVGTCPPERLRYAVETAEHTARTVIPDSRLAVSLDPVDEAIALAPWVETRAGAVIEFPTGTPTTEIIGEFAHPSSPARLVGVTCVVDAPHLLDDLGRDDYLAYRAPDGGRTLRAAALAAVTQIEYASTVVLVGWERLSTPDLSLALAIVSALSPRCRLRLHPAPSSAPELHTEYAAVQERPGWIAVLNDGHAPHMTDARVSALRYEALRPFHPGRLAALLDGPVDAGVFGTVLRSAGFCRLATRPHVTAHWEHVGRMLSFQPLATDDDLGVDDELLAAGQDLAFIGLDLDRAGIVAALDAACLTDDEFAAGPEAWADLPDPFPAWEGAGAD
ncbi:MULTISPECIES: GTP-binding protein [unclassified Microbacterium]|uniref:GTP-binding protein n=1 Tax=Microbacterium TaxID=33882 RepID=UPI003B9F72E0